MLSEVQSKCRVQEGSKLHEQESTKNRNKNPKEEGLTGPRGGGKMA